MGGFIGLSMPHQNKIKFFFSDNFSSFTIKKLILLPLPTKIKKFYDLGLLYVIVTHLNLFPYFKLSLNRRFETLSIVLVSIV